MIHPIFTKIGYISGPMSGYPDSNFPAFAEAAKDLRALGYTVISPHELGEEKTWQDCMRKDLIALMSCHYIILLPGWATSKGAFLELHNAILLGMPVYTWNGVELERQSKLEEPW